VLDGCRRARRHLAGNRTTNFCYRALVGLIGGIVLAVGVIAIPYPGPGWLIVFAGLAILATEFAWAQHVLRYARGRYDAWNAWQRRQHWALRLTILAATGLVVVTTVWLLGAFHLAARFVGLGHWTWLQSPIA
jgi:uncharacterized protein (TIGR02611 family)